MTLSLTVLTAASQVLVRASVDKDHILIGEPIKLMVDARLPLGQRITWFRLDTIPHFTILDSTKLQSDDGIDGKKLQQQWTITSFDSGRWEIPRMQVTVGDKAFLSDTLGIQINYAPYDLSQDYHDIKDIQPVAVPRVDYLPWLIAATIFAVLAIALLYWLRKKNATDQKAAVPKLTPYEEAIRALEELRRQGFHQNGTVKIYYTRLNDILRLFVLRKLNVSTVERTNDELILQLKPYNLSRDEYTRLVQALRVADFVKFAQYRPEASDNEQNFLTIQSAITTLNNIVSEVDLPVAPKY